MIDSIGTVAVGTTDTHSWNNVFDGRIRVGARGVLATTTASTQLGHNFYYDGAYKYIGADFATRYYSNNGEHVWLTAPSGSADGTITFSSPRMVINNAGNVGIGTSAPQSWSRLQVTGTAGSQPSGSGAQALYVNAPTTTANEGVGIRLSAASGSKEAVGIIGMVNNASGNSGSMTFHTYNAGATIPEVMRIDNTGNVGIGTNSPYKKLTLSAAFGTQKVDLLDLQSTTGGGGTQPMIRFGTMAGNSNTMARIGVVDIPNYGGGFVVETNGSGAATDTTTERFRIDKDGLVTCLLYTSPSPRDS